MTTGRTPMTNAQRQREKEINTDKTRTSEREREKPVSNVQRYTKCRNEDLCFAKTRTYGSL